MPNSFVILKPDSLGNVGRIISRFEDKKFKILDIQLRSKSLCWAEQHYFDLPPDIKHRVTDAMSWVPLIGILLEAPPEVVKRMVGATDSYEALPGTIRGDFGIQPIHCNVIHCADPDKVDLEYHLFTDSKTDYWEV